MKYRCLKPKYREFYLYGGRGITVSESWTDFENFYKDMLPTYQEGLSLDRINSNGNYCKENCRWVTMEVQQNNRRNNHLYELDGIADTLTHWAIFFNLKQSTLEMRVGKYGWDLRRALHTPARAIGGTHNRQTQNTNPDSQSETRQGGEYQQGVKR